MAAPHGSSCEAVNKYGLLMRIAGKRFIVLADEKLTACLELEAAISRNSN
jgi:hypothetical protein